MMTIRRLRMATSTQARCQVVGCDADLQEDGKYNVKKRLCAAHMRADSVLRNDCGHRKYRFCFQCGKLEPLTRFSTDKRSCKASLSQRRKIKCTKAPGRKTRVARQRGGATSSSAEPSCCDDDTAVDAVTVSSKTTAGTCSAAFGAGGAGTHAAVPAAWASAPQLPAQQPSGGGRRKQGTFEAVEAILAGALANIQQQQQQQQQQHGRSSRQQHVAGSMAGAAGSIQHVQHVQQPASPLPPQQQQQLQEPLCRLTPTDVAELIEDEIMVAVMSPEPGVSAAAANVVAGWILDAGEAQPAAAAAGASCSTRGAQPPLQLPPPAAASGLRLPLEVLLQQQAACGHRWA